MTSVPSPARFQDAVATVEALAPDDQQLLIEIVRQRLLEQRRGELAKDVAEAREAYQRGDVCRGTVDELMEELKD